MASLLKNVLTLNGDIKKQGLIRCISSPISDNNVRIFFCFRFFSPSRIKTETDPPAATILGEGLLAESLALIEALFISNCSESLSLKVLTTLS